MSDPVDEFESRVREAIAHGVDGEAPTGLAERVRVRSRQRRRRTTLAVAAASVAVLGVTATALLGNGGGGGALADDPTATPSVVHSGPPQRLESWRDVQVSVPVSWGYGALSTWCTKSATPPGTPVVDRPEGIRDMILCTEPANGYGVIFSDPATFAAAEPPGKVWRYSPGDHAVYPDGAWLGYQRSDDAMAFVVAPDRAGAELVLSSFVRVTDVDANGCLTKNSDETRPVTGGWLRLCRYTSDGWLSQSETLTNGAAAEAVAALDAAPPGPARRCPASLDLTTVEVTTPDAQGVVNLDTCMGMSWGGEHHHLTADVLHWVLSPGWLGALDGGLPLDVVVDGVPLPDQLRQ